LLAEFPDAPQLVSAVRRAQLEAHHAPIEVYSPVAVEGLGDALRTNRGRIPLWTLLGALLGGISTYALQWYSAVINYPLDIGGRPTMSWPAFLPAALEMTILGAALFGVIATWATAQGPRLHHPLFASHAFERASSDRFFLVLRADAPGFDLHHARAFLETLTPLSITEVAQ
jgi:hypothetical protein